MNLARRLDVLELLVTPQRRAGLTAVLVRGGLTDGVGGFARAGDLHWERLPLESVAAFHARCHADATAARAPFLIVGGLDLDAPDTP